MLKFMRRARGSVTIFLLVIMMPMLVFSFTVVDLCRIFTAQDVVACAADEAVNSALTSYDKVLKDMYGLMATSADEKELAEKMSDYYVMTLSANGVKLSEEDKSQAHELMDQLFQSNTVINLNELTSAKNLLNIQAEDLDDGILEAILVPESAISNPSVMKRQVVEYMKYRGPVKIATGMLSKITALSDLPKQTEAVEKKMEFEKEIAEVGASAQSVYTLFRIYFHNSQILEDVILDNKLNYGGGGTADFKRIYADIDKIKDVELDLMKRYQINYCLGSVFPVRLRDVRNGKFCYSNMANVTVTDICQVEQGMVAMSFIAPFYKDNDTQKKLDIKPSTKSEEELMTTLKSYIDGSKKNAFTTILSAPIPEGQYNSSNYFCRVYIDVEFISVEESGQTSYKPKYSEDENDKAVMKALNDFLPLYIDDAGRKSSMDTDFADDYTKFMSCYLAAEKLAEDSSDDEETDNEEETDSEEDDSASEETISDVVESAKSLYSDLNNLSRKVRNFVSEIHLHGNSIYESGANELTEYYYYLYQQYAILKRLTEDEDSLKKVYEEFIKAADAAVEYKKGVDGMSDPSMKASLGTQCKDATESFVSQNGDSTEPVKVLDDAAYNELISKLNDQKQLYHDVLDWISSTYVFNLNNCFYKNIKIDEKPTDSHKSESDIHTLTYPTKEVFELISKEAESFTTITCVDADKAFQKPFHSLCPGKLQNYNKWSDLIDGTITDNAVFKQIEKLALPTRETNRDSTAKDQITEMGKTDSDGMPKTASSGGSGGSSSIPSTDGSGNSGGVDINEYFNTETVEASSVTSFENYYNKTEGGISANSTSVSVGTGNDDDSTTSSATNALSSVGNFMKDLLTATRDNLYVTEYLTSSFSCHTTNLNDGKLEKDDSKKEKNLMNELFREDTNAYRGELEYILYGFDNNAKNVAAASGIIFALRFVLNLIYSFTDSEINGITNSIASTAAGLFPFAIPIVKTVLHIGLAIAESGYDMVELLKGNSVPLFKDTTTWVCKPSNLGKAVIGEVIETVGGVAIDAAADGVSQLIDEAAAKGEEFTAEGNEKVQEYIKEQTESIKSTLKNTIQTPFEMKLQELMLSVPETYNVSDTKASFGNALISLKGDLLESLGISESNHSENLLQEAEWAVLSKLDDSKLREMAGTAVDNLEDYISQSTGVSIDTSSQAGWETTASNLSGLVSGKIFKPLNDLIDKVADKGTDLANKIEGKVNEAISDLAKQAKEGTLKGAENLKEGLHNKMNEFVGSPAKTGGSGTKIDLSKDKDAKIDLDEKKGKSSLGSIIKMSYKDYLYIFTLIGLCANESAMLQRTAQIMTVNCQKKLGDDTYSLNEAVTFIGAKTKGSVKTVFYGAVFSDGKLDFSGKPDRYSFTKTAYMGY